MLLSFRFANHRSFRDEQQLNLMPVYDAEGEVAEDGTEAVPVVGVFGANASGKSNVISAFDYLRTMVRSSDRESEPGVGPRRYPFRLDPEAVNEPSSYAIDLMLGGVRYTYGFTVDDKRIVEEWLYSYPYRRKRVIFERSGQAFVWGEESGKSRIRRLEEIVAPTALFLSVAARFDAHNPETGEPDASSASLHALYLWLQQEITQATPSSGGPALLGRNYSRFLEKGDHRSAIEELLRAADVGLEKIIVSHTKRKVQFRHRGSISGANLSEGDESCGTLRLLELGGNAIPILANGGLLLVDEIDSSLHPLLTATLIRLFQSPVANPKKAQLVFTTHDATLLSSIDGEDVLRRDEVWFTSKGEDGVSELFPLAEFKPRRLGENRQKRYLNGSYGAIPQLSMDLFERAVTTRADAGAE